MAHFDAYVKGQFFTDADTAEELIDIIALHHAEPHAFTLGRACPPEAWDVLHYNDKGEEDVFSQQRLKIFNLRLADKFYEAVRELREWE